MSDEKRLEALWGGDFGDAYVDRNRGAGQGRGPFWNTMLERTGARDVLEVGCNVGGNLRWIVDKLGPETVTGIDINEKALEEIRATLKIRAELASATKLPFVDATFDLVFTMGVLIHQSPEALSTVMSEIVRTSRRWVLCGEYFADDVTEVPYRGHAGALYKRDFGGDYQRLFPHLSLVDKGFLPKSSDTSWDDVTWWLFEK
jgi:pseudaminic acid biosynthesis-associated methylase